MSAVRNRRLDLLVICGESPRLLDRRHTKKPDANPCPYRQLSLVATLSVLSEGGGERSETVVHEVVSTAAAASSLAQRANQNDMRRRDDKRAILSSLPLEVTPSVTEPK